jgi:polysaccharide pyruvyl transferase WcaK-like protein
MLNDGKDFSNWGIKAATDGLETILFDTFKDATLNYLPHSIFIKNYKFDPVIFGKRLFNRNSRLANRFIGENIMIPRVSDEFEYVAAQWLKEKRNASLLKVIKSLRDSDVIVFNAEGSCYRNNRSAIRGLFMLWFSSKILNKKAYFLNGSVTLTAVDPILPGMINRTFSQIDGATIREVESYDCITSLYPHLAEKIAIAPDTAFSLKLCKSDENRIIKKIGLNTDYICFSTSMLPIDYMRSGKESALYDLLIRLKKIVPKVVVFARDIEDQFLKKVCVDTDSIFVGKDYSYSDVSCILKNSKCLISGRYHHLIFAVKMGCPIVPLNTTSHKIIGLIRFFGSLAPKVYDPTSLKLYTAEIVEAVKFCVLNREKLSQSYMKISSDCAIKSFENAKVISESLNKVGNK